MNDLTREEKWDLIIEVVKEYNITAYEIAKGTGLTEAGILNIIQKKSKRPHESSLNEILNYLENTLAGRNIAGTYNYFKKNIIRNVAEEEIKYEVSNKMIAQMIKDLGISINKHHSAFADGIEKIWSNTEDIKDSNLLINESVDRLISRLGSN